MSGTRCQVASFPDWDQISGAIQVQLGEGHLRRVLTAYSTYYNDTRTHLGLGKDAPLRRAIERSGTIVATPFLAGLHHRYARI